MMRIVVSIMIALLMAGCSIRSKSYYLLDGQEESEKKATIVSSVGIENITLPRYFEQSNVALKRGENQVTFISKAHWVSNMNEHLTGVLISYLKRYFNTTEIYLYPWDVSHKVARKVIIKVENFIYHDKNIFLDASWEISEKGGRKTAQFFHTKVPSSADTDAIVKHMDEAFSALEVAIAKSL